MWTGEWNTGWGSKYTMDANVNLQTAALNSSNMSRGPQGYVYFLLRQMPDWEENARATHGFTDAIQAPVNTDGDKAVLTETCYPYPFRYWNAGASWMLRPLYETLQSYGNIQIPLSDEFNLQALRSVLSVTEKDLTDAQVAAMERRGYLRLEEGGSDYVIRTCAVDDVVCAAVRRFAGEFIDRRIALDYTPVEWETVTDGKWLTFVVEQLLSNALKYTGQDGTIRIYREGDDLCIRDSGIGIAPEDLPRVFQMGYTGQNGRLDRRSSGIGLYLCRRICGNLRHGIRMESVPGKGTTVYLTLGRGDFLPE